MTSDVLSGRFIEILMVFLLLQNDQSNCLMKKYLSLGELLIDYRKLKKISQTDFAVKLDVDIRTVSRWEKDETLVKPEKEEELAEETFIPYQVVHNLNALVAIPTYYDFRIRKYSLAELSNELPDTEWLKDQIETPTKRVRTIELKTDIDSILRYVQFQHNQKRPLNRQLIVEAAKILPELNLIIVDDTGHYSGHCIVFPINKVTYKRLKDHEISETEISIYDLTDFKNEEKPIFHFYDITADCNENMFYIAGVVLKFFKELHNKDYTVSSITHRYDSYESNNHLGLRLIWEDKEAKDVFGENTQARFYEGDFKEFLGE